MTWSPASVEMLPRAEIAHWLFGAGFLFFGLVLLAEAIVGPEVFRRRPWRAYLWPSLALLAGMWLWVIAIFSTFSTLHLLAHSVWAQAATAAGAVQLAVVRRRLLSPYWSLVIAGALLVSIPVVVLFVVLSRYLISGLTLGAVKG